MLIIRQAIFLFLSFNLLFSGSGIQIKKHYCGGNLKSISLLPAEKSCCSSNEKSPCCNNTTQLVQADVNLQVTQLANFDFSSTTFFKTLSFTKHIQYTNLLASVFVYIPQKIPPLQDKDIYILVQRFLL